MPPEVANTDDDSKKKKQELGPIKPILNDSTLRIIYK